MRLLFSVVILISLFTSVNAQEYPIPASEEHGRLKALVGVWDAEIEMTTPDGATSSKGVEKVRMLGDLWVVSDFSYDYMGKPVSGHGTTGYDPSTGKYIGTWVESGSPYISTMEGEYDEEKKATVYLMKSKDEKGNDAEYKVVDTQIDDTHKRFELHAKVGDEFMKVLTIKYTKRDE